MTSGRVCLGHGLFYIFINSRILFIPLVFIFVKMNVRQMFFTFGNICNAFTRNLSSSGSKGLSEIERRIGKRPMTLQNTDNVRIHFCQSSTVASIHTAFPYRQRKRRSPDLTFSRSRSQSTEHMSSEEKAKKFQRPKAQSTIDEQEISHFSALSSLWWDEGGEFEALHSLNELRIPLIRDAMMSQKTIDQYRADKPLEGFWVLDVGSGGGILSEPLARLGASVIGVEASEENIKIAQAHLLHDPAIRDNIKYIHTTVEDIAETQAGKFDAVVASEVLEHVADANMFVSSACKLVRPGGSVFFTTLNKTAVSYALGIVVAEQMLKLVSPGTHDWDKFIAPLDLQYMLEKNNFSTRLVHGMWYNPFSKRWSWSKDTSINYALHAVRAPAVEALEENVWTTETESASEPAPQKD
ncbi:ubiquinone biosynthesis O-methyltransferase, mitochondrial [Aplysia californica]|uniref:Ubiquinone biosynthesis O-methyltransferase, mitochondrial n=1 Tax=Aplysia californica TaxID=6500 RepID=A0ABM0K683_APLCA|nr:ubiquinone biosynthesis O-methyltransferase, mitochondrial [Aplysia californica]